MIRYLKHLGLGSFGDYAKAADEDVMAAFYKRQKCDALQVAEVRAP
jgi:hypothetical protein